ncbi:CU044_5270 family protein [Streptomyces griseosporeus]|uniref:CU044_5270 family protein n=1 Tax=Streptomyces griseosporeus TaxID=1910 RepID=UPI003703189A
MNHAEREELAALLPSPGDPVLFPERLARMEARLRRETAEPGPVRLRRDTGAGTGRPVRHRRYTAIALGLATAAAVVAALLTAGAGPAGQPSTDPEAVRLLDRIAAVAAVRDAPEVRDGQYVFTLTQGTRQVVDEGRDTVRRADWQAVDGRRHGLARITVLSGPSGTGTYDMRLGADPDGVTYRELQALPTGTDALYDRIWSATRGQGPTHEEAGLERIGSLLPTAALLPEVNAVLYRVAARIPGVEVVDHAEDAAGRAGIGLAFGGGRDRDVWVFREADLRYLGTAEAALLDVAVVDEAGGTPAARGSTFVPGAVPVR